ncbi:exo-alpha-sialidase [Saccharopolyspora aridisoli]|uniref:Exo-alpha-sialidase n=1 Tax=Saccharopolyspora aridisoli TaxID=2530385 RepID=A0A4R4UR35_9PSEU|nr:exo-alpha-sialidase [Saccharopolyspora aridisoli]
MVYRKVRALLVVLFSAALVAAGFQHAALSAPAPGDVGTQDVDKGELLRVGGSSYPRLVRLENSGEANGRVLSSMTTYRDNAGFAVIFESRDDGKTFQPLSEIRDPAGEDTKGMCCSTLYELPQQVGDMPAGTLLWAGSAGIGSDEDERRTSIRVWRSDDHGKTWSYLSDLVQAPVGPGVWEPEFTVSEQGDLVAFYSDDSDPKHDQKLVQVRSSDGRNWTDVKDMLKNDEFTVRPGMSGVRKLPDGTYLMVYEVCNYDPVHTCTVWIRESSDGWDWGDPYDLGTEIVSDTGGQPLGTPTIALAPGPNPNGRLLLGYQMLGGDNGGWAPGNGKTVMVNDNPEDLDGPWKEVPSPVQLSYNQGSSCRNFSPTLLATEDGESMIHVTTDFEHYIGGPCEAFYGVGPIDGGTAAAKSEPRPMDTRIGR